MSNFFNLDNPVWNFMGKLVDVFILTILWIVCSLPIFTIGPATTAVYYVTLKLVRDEESYTVRSFFKSFKQNFKQGVPIGLIELGLGLFFIWDIYLYYQLGSVSTAMSIMGIIFIGIFLIYLLALVYVFPLQAKFYNTVKQTLKNSVIMSIKHIWRSLGMLLIAVAVIIGCLFFPPLLLLSTGLIAFLQSFVMVHIFDKYIPKEDLEKEDEFEAESAGIDEEQPVHIVMTADDMAMGGSQVVNRDTLTRNEEAQKQIAEDAAADAAREAESQSPAADNADTGKETPQAESTAADSAAAEAPQTAGTSGASQGGAPAGASAGGETAAATDDSQNADKPAMDDDTRSELTQAEGNVVGDDGVKRYY